MLIDYEVKTKQEIIENISSEVEIDEIISAREVLFRNAVEVYCDRNELSTTPDVCMKNRKGENAIISCSRDLYDLYTYIMCDSATFPRDICKNTSQLVELLPSENIENSDNTAVVNGQVSFEQLYEIVVVLQNTVSDQQLQLTQLERRLVTEQSQHQLETVNWNNKLAFLLTKLENSGLVQLQTEKNGEIVDVSFKEPNKQKKTQHENRSGPAQHRNKDRETQGEEAQDPPPLQTRGHQDGRNESDDHISVTSTENSDTHESYAGVVRNNNNNNNNNEWSIPKSTKRRQAREKQKDTQKENSRQLKAAFSGETSTMYVENVHIDSSDTIKVIQNDIREYMKEQNVSVLNSYVIFNKFRRDRCGVKIEVPLKFVNQLKQEHFWPRGITCRQWEQRRPKENRNRDNTHDDDDKWNEDYDYRRSYD